MDSLGGKYLSEYNEVCKYLKRRAKKSEALSDALAELFEIYSAAQESSAALEHVRGESLSDYEHALLEGLPKKEHPFLHRYIIAAAAVLIGVLTAAYFTSDEHLLGKYGYAFCYEHPEKFNLSTEYQSYGAHSGTISLDDFGNTVNNEYFEKRGIKFLDFMLYSGDSKSEHDDTQFDITARSVSVSTGSDSGMIYSPVRQDSFGTFISLDQTGYIKALLNGCWYIGSVEAYQFDESGVAYTLHFEAESPDDPALSHNIARLVCGDELYICFEGFYRTRWSYKGAAEVLKSGKLPFFSHCSAEIREVSSTERIRYSMVTSDNKLEVVFYSVYDAKLGGQRLAASANPRKLSAEVDYADTWIPLSINDDGEICATVTYYLMDGEMRTESLKAEKQTPLVRDTYEENISGTHYALVLKASRDSATGKFTAVDELSYSSNTSIFSEDMFKESKTSYEITTDGDVAVTVWHLADQTNVDSGYIESTVVFDHSKY
mgnify:CR=1 FL=1